MINFDEALACVLEHARHIESKSCPVAEVCGLALAENVSARLDNPRFDNSAMDGYAVRSADLVGASHNAPIALEVIEEIPAGTVAERNVGEGQATRIMTGAPLPRGADAVVMVERTEGSGDTVRILHAPRAWENIRRRSEDISAGETLIERGQTIRPQDILALTSQGITDVDVHRPPKVAILATGDELTPPGEELEDSHIYDGSSLMLTAQVRSSSAVPVPLGIVRDDRRLIEEKVREGMKADCILMTGGVSVGDYDFNREVLERMGMKEVFWRIAMKPGKPILFGTIEGGPVFGMPGNPIATLVAFEVFVRPALRKMMGCTAPFDRRIHAKLAAPVKRNAKRDQFLMATLGFEGSEACVMASGPQGSAHVRPALGSNCLVRIPLGEGSQSADEVVEVWPLWE